MAAGDPRRVTHPDSSQARTNLERNLRWLERRCPKAVDAIRAAVPRTDVVFSLAPDGGLTGEIRDALGGRRRLASAHQPRLEGERLAGTIDITKNAAVVVLGLGVGHHAGALANKLGREGGLVIFEPDASLLRAVLEQAEMPWLGATNVALVIDAEDRGALASAVHGMEALLAAGTAFLDHPPSRARLGPLGSAFSERFTGVLKAVRTTVLTTLVQVDVTVRNLLQNAGAYVTSAGVEDLRGAAAGSPAVVVSAGPSLHRNVELLAHPGVRERVVIIAVQTVLKTLLARGIKPHFVTALDYHEISARFYEGLTAADVEGVTLVVEPKANPAILKAWPGAVRCVGDHVLDQILGETLAREMGELTPGATVAHLAYYLARHLGCDPAIMIGQDLGFTDGQYYAPGAAIHQVWSSELNEFCTLEMLEWSRIARMRSMLRTVRDQLGRDMYTDEQMATYLVQFERDFGRDAAAGLTTIDATEGGVHKQNTRVMTLKEALAGAVGGARLELPTPKAPADAAVRRKRLEQRLLDLRRSSARVGLLSRETGTWLEEMLRHHEDQPRVNRLIAKAHAAARDVTSESANWIVQHVNQTGQLNRFKADRAIAAEDALTPMQRQAREIERDAQNVRWLADASDLVGTMLDDAVASLRTGIVRTREPAPDLPTGVSKAPAPKVLAVVLAHTSRGGLGQPRDLARSWKDSPTLLAETLARVKQMTGVAGVVVLSDSPDFARALAGPGGSGAEFVQLPAGAEARASRVAAARRWSRWCWRGGIGGMSCYDEVVDPAVIAPVLERHGAGAAVVLGGDWCLVDPALGSLIIERHREHPSGRPITFAHVAPGLAPVLVSAGALRDMASAGGPAATIGAMLSYVPIAPQSDPIAKPVCVSAGYPARDLLVRCIPDTPTMEATLEAAARAVPSGAAAEIAAVLAPATPADAEMWTLHVTRQTLRVAVQELTREIVPANAPAVTLVGESEDVLQMPGLREAVSVLRNAGAHVHVRTRLDQPGMAVRLASVRPDAASIELLADDESTYSLLGGNDFGAARNELAIAVEQAFGPGRGERPAPLPTMWIVPRLTRRDEVYTQVERVFDRFLLTCGACVIDPPPAGVAGRIRALPLPAGVQDRRQAAERTVIRDFRSAAAEFEAALQGEMPPVEQTA